MQNRVHEKSGIEVELIRNILFDIGIYTPGKIETGKPGIGGDSRFVESKIPDFKTVECR